MNRILERDSRRRWGALVALAAAGFGCSASGAASGDPSDPGSAGQTGTSGAAGDAGSSAGVSGSSAGASGTMAGASGTSSAGTSGAADAGASGASGAGASGTSGAGTSGASGAGAGGGSGAGASGASGAGGSAGMSGSAGKGGTSGASGTGGAGMSGMGGTAGAGAGGSGGAGTSGAGGGAGTSGAGGSGGSSCGVSPVDPGATAQAKNLLCYLYSQYKNHVLSGQQETSWSNPVDDINFYVSNTGKYPAILGGDFLYVGTSPSSQGTTVSRAQAYWAAGGITMIRYHMGAPPNSDSYENSMLKYTSAQCDNVITSGTTENTSYKAKLDGVANNLLTLQNAGVAVILALFHETQPTGWFWWSTCSNSQFLALYNYSYDYLVKTKGVHNIVRLMPFSGSPNAGVYPGKAVSDLAGPDTYSTGVPFANMYKSTANFVGTTVPIPLHETGTIPQPPTMFPTAAPWLLWNVWAGYEKSANSVGNIQSAYASSYTVTRDEIPSLK